MKTRCVAYCRVSTERDQQIESLKKQQEYFEELAKNRDYDLVHLYVDEGLSGKQAKNRVQFLQMMKDAESGMFDLVLVKDVSRFARNTEDFIHNIRKLKSYGLNVFFVTHNLSIQEGSEFYLTMLAALAQEESAKLSDRIKFGKNITAKKGRVPNFVFGYDKVDNYTLVPNGKESEIVRNIFDLFVNKKYGTARIAGWLNENSIPTKKNKVANWYQTVVIQILRNQIYIGKVINKKSEVIDFITGTRKKNNENVYVTIDRPEFQIIDTEVFNKAQQLLEDKKESFNLGNKKDSIKYPLSNLLKCSECGYSFRRIQRQYSENGKLYKRWVCSYRNAKGKNACINTAVIDEDDFINQFIDWSKYISENKNEIAKMIIKEIKDRIKQQNKSHVKTQNEYQKELDVLNNKKQKYMDMYTNEIIGIEELKNFTKTINLELQKVTGELNLLKNKDVINFNIERAVYSRLDNIIKMYSETDITNEKLKENIESFDVNSDGTIRFNMKISTIYNINEYVPYNNNHTYGTKNMEWYLQVK